MIQSIIGEIRAAARQLRQHPGFTLGATFSLALGMSLATAVFSVVSAARRTLPFPEPDRLIAMYGVGIPGKTVSGSAMPARHLVAMQDEATVFARLAAYKSRFALLGESGAARGVSAVAITGDFFVTLGVGPMMGRTFAEEDRNDNVILLSNALWKSQFGSELGIVGRRIRINAIEHTVLGVMPPTVDYFPRGARIWFFVSEAQLRREAVDRDQDAAAPEYTAIARLKPGVSVERAAAEAGTLYSRIYRGRPIRGNFTTGAVLLSGYVNGGLRSQLILWSTAAGMILVLCAVNFASMSLSRGMRRRGELAVRAAIGASQAQLVRASIIEAFLMALISGALAIVFAAWLLGLARAWFAGGGMPVEPGIDWETIGFGLVATVVVGFAFALAPAIELARVDLRQILSGDTAGATSRRGEMRGRCLLVSLQMAFALTAVASVAALIKADRRWQAWDVGIDYEQLVLGDLHAPPRPDRTWGLSAAAINRDTAGDFVAPLPVLERLNSTPGISDVAMITTFRPVSAFYPNGEHDKIYWMEMRATPNLFKTLGVQLLAGRLPTDAERRADNVYVVSDRFALIHAPSYQDAIGKRVVIHRGTRRPKETITIVGVVPSYGGSGLWNVSSSLYALQDPAPARFATVVIRVRGDPQVQANGLARQLAGVDPRIMVSSVATAKSTVEAAQRGTRGRKIFLAWVSALALVLAIIGVYSLTSYTADLRMREFGIRLALGASAPSLARAVFGDLWWMSAIGVVVGAMASSRVVDFLDAMFRNPFMSYRLVTLPVGSLLTAAATLAFIAVIGTGMPLRRILRMDVMRTVQGGG